MFARELPCRTKRISYGRSSKTRRSHGQLAYFITSLLLLIRSKKSIRCGERTIGLRGTRVGVDRVDYVNYTHTIAPFFFSCDSLFLLPMIFLYAVRCRASHLPKYRAKRFFKAESAGRQNSRCLFRSTSYLRRKRCRKWSAYPRVAPSSRASPSSRRG